MTESQLDALADAVPAAPAPARSPYEIWKSLPSPRPSLVEVIAMLRDWRDHDELELLYLPRTWNGGHVSAANIVAAYRYRKG